MSNFEGTITVESKIDDKSPALSVPVKEGQYMPDVSVTADLSELDTPLDDVVTEFHVTAYNLKKKKVGAFKITRSQHSSLSKVAIPLFDEILKRISKEKETDK